MEATNNAEGGTDTVTATSGNSGGASGTAWTNVTLTTATFTYDSSQKAHGGLAYKITQPATPSSTYGEWQSAAIGTSASLWGRIYLRFSAVPGLTVRVIRFMNGTTIGASMLVNATTGTVSWHASTSGTTAVGTATNGIPANQWVRVEFNINFASGATGSATANLYTSMDSTTIDSTGAFSSASTNTITACNQIRIGNITNDGVQSGTTWMDDIVVNDTGFPGPALLPPELLAVGGYTRGIGPF